MGICVQAKRAKTQKCQYVAKKQVEMEIYVQAKRAKTQNCQYEQERKEVKKENDTGKNGEIANLPVHVIAF